MPTEDFLDLKSLTTCQLRDMIVKLENQYPMFRDVPRPALELHHKLCQEYWNRPDWPCMEPAP